MRVAIKIPLLIIASGLVLALVTGAISVVSSIQALRDQTGNRLSAILDNRAVGLEAYLGNIEDDLLVQARNPFITEALDGFIAAWAEIEGDPQAYLQKAYIDGNPHPTGKKENLDMATDGSRYSELHGRYHPWLRSFLRQNGYYDIFLFDPAGNLVYTVFKELDYATNLNSGKWRNNDLGKAFRAARDSAQAGDIAFFDFKPYAPSHDAPASFIATPIMKDDGSLAGVLTFQMPIDRLNANMQVAAGLGETGETINALALEEANKAREVEVRRAEEANKAREVEARRAEERLRSEMQALSDALDKEVQHAVTQIAQQTDEMAGLAGRMSGSTAAVKDQSSTVASASALATQNVQTVAAAAEEMSATIDDINRQVGESTKISDEAVGEIERTNRTVEGLSTAAQKIGQVIQMISDIAEQTNLLALNATIESARAGDAGKGFAVVANEVKILANQTATATGEITKQIAAVQQGSSDTVEAIRGIGGTVNRINELANSVSSAIEQQNAATREIARNVTEAAAGTREVTSGISTVVQASDESGDLAGKVKSSAEIIAGQVRDLQGTLTAVLRDSAASAGSETKVA